MINQGNILTAAEMKRAEQKLIDSGVSVDELMRRAGQGAAQMIWRVAADMPTLVLCGPGNNGGDGYVIAQWLRDKGVEVGIAAAADPTTAAARHAKSLWHGETVLLEDAQPAAQFVDCLFGTGLTRAIGDGWFSHFSRLFAGAKRRVAIDLPSGVESDHGLLLNDLPAFDMTVTLGAYKPSHYLEPARSKMGDLVGIDIGISADSNLEILPKPRISGPTSLDHKYSRGLVAVVAGAMPGAAQLTAMAAQKAGAGYVKILAPSGFSSPHPSIVVETVQDMADLQQKLSDKRISAIIVGPGLGRDDRAKELLTIALAADAPLVIDADALTVAGPQFTDLVKGRSAETIATPHGGEFAALTGRAPEHKIDDSRQLAQQSGCSILLKGSDTVIAGPDGKASISAQDCPWQSTAGTGDILAGIIASRLATGLSAYKAACEGQWLHSRAGQLAGPAFTPEMLVDQIPASLQECL
ncbi:NAD(P)H-hydrate dehydratase [uncultured Parasphingorhabdus sp.]|uniref:NAD(P)H-hydrate dehydratase n=1 Tax=uncultured Parasphingorhabdus sp. TaxID=2709694 RepID=UPI002AA7738B|nr:NAD(P)H-hydrate dehydratase [uncultured Parasphingorhabdus sp.]